MRVGSVASAVALVGVLVTGPSAAAEQSPDVGRDPTVLTAADYDGSSSGFGSEIDVDGDLMAVGAPSDHTLGPSDPPTYDGSAYVFVRTDQGWVQQAKIVPEDIERNDRFGTDVAVSGDTLVIGSEENNLHGSAYVYVRSGDTWALQAKLNNPDPGPSYDFGSSVAIEGDTIVVGASGGAGKTWVFVRAGTRWEVQDRLQARDGEDRDEFGYDVAIQGVTILVGSIRANSSTGDNSGAVYVFRRSGTDWKFRTKLTGSNPGDGDRFGASVALDGKTVVVGAQYYLNPVGSRRGAAYVFVRTKRKLTQQAVLRAPYPEVYGAFGHEVAINDDTVVVADADDTASGGGVHVFTRTDGTWDDGTDLLPPRPVENESLGFGLAIDDGLLAVSRFSFLLPVYHEEVLVFESP